MARDLQQNLEKEVDVDELVPSLPKAQGWLVYELALYQGFWCPTKQLGSIISFQRHFEAQDEDIILASKPKSGTTWLKALIFSIVNRTRYTFSNSPLLTSNPHELVPSVEATDLFTPTERTTIQSPRLLATHIPYAALPESVKKSSNCRIVYIFRNPFDVAVSSWHFATQSTAETEVQRSSMEEYLDMLFKGIDGYGPIWDHVLGYWKDSLEKPNKVLFFKYEDLKEDIVSNLKRLAEFIGYPFSKEEEREGVVEKIAKICSLSSLKDLDVNKNGRYSADFPNKAFFRKGKVGDWENYFSPSVKQKLANVMEQKLSASGLSFNISARLSHLHEEEDQEEASCFN